jgi:hypothetical protein
MHAFIMFIAIATCVYLLVAWTVACYLIRAMIKHRRMMLAEEGKDKPDSPGLTLVSK